MFSLDDTKLNKSPFKRLLPSVYRRLGLAGLPRFTVKKRYGQNYLLDTTNLIDRSMIFRFGWEGEKFEQFSEFVSSRFTSNIMFLDVGSHWGLYAIRMAQVCGVTDIHAFEPDRRNLNQLFANLFLNDLEDRIQVHPVAVTDHAGEISFLQSTSQNRGVSRIAGEEDTGQIRKVPCDRLDQLVTPRGRQVAIKIDVEGGEIGTIRGMTDLLSNNQVIAMVEIDRKLLDTTISELKTHGLTFVQEARDSKGETDYIFTNF